MTFKEEVKIENEKLTITVSCEMRKFSIDPKLFYERKVEELIPEELRNKVRLISSPVNKVSNTNYANHAPRGQWIFEIIKPESKATNKKTLKPRTRTTRNKK